ncbi:MAG: sucrose-6-phosphate hydrolase SacC (GH32 family) [Candidatus Krumholzibacteriia bacterium]|jgi:sucrose-6-phosphate hydrolase SacC (GH32 family)
MLRLSPWRKPTPSGLAASLLLGIFAAIGVSFIVAPNNAQALVRFDFEQKYYQHANRQVWDFSIVRSDSIYHIFYHSIHEQTPNATFGDTIWQASSQDLKHWGVPIPILTVGDDPWDAGAVWAPDVVWEEANNRWAMAYTGNDLNFNQTICFAYSENLVQWHKAPLNPIVQADPTLYVWQDTEMWSDFRDPFIYGEDGDWHVLVTAQQDLSGNTGVLYHGVSTDLNFWSDVGPIFINDGIPKWRPLESPQYITIGSTHHLLFGEFDTLGTTLLSATSPAGWTMANRVSLDAGYAPEVDQFDEGVHLFSRLGNFLLPNESGIGYVVRMDTLLTNPDGSNPSVYKPHPMSENWVVHTGTANIGNPTFGDNPIWRGEPSVGMVGNSYYASHEYHQGPLSGRGAPGSKLGDPTTGVAETKRFQITGDRMTLLVGGGDYPATCYIALVDSADSSIIYSETGGGNATMTLRTWNLAPYQGRTCYITIVDNETQAMGHITVDEIIEIADPTGVNENTPNRRDNWHSAFPNPFNPRTTISFDLQQPASCLIQIYDLRGRMIWRSNYIAGRQGTNQVNWDGTIASGEGAAAASYVYIITIAGQRRGQGKLVLVK